jgi:NAD(P)-dependent dehydrogenase (short-subunit alcohol dehydrogenase family)
MNDMSWSLTDVPDLSGLVAVVTGANGGLGLASAEALAGAGAHVVMAARDQEKVAAAVAHIEDAHPGASLEVVELDLASLASVQAAAGHVTRTHDRVHVLMNNAGVMAMPEGRTADGFERQLGINHLGHWALTSYLLPLVVRTPGARVVSLTSTAQHFGRRIDTADPHQRKGYDAWRQYGNTKLANRHFAQGLQRQLTRAGVDAIALTAHPGLSNSDLQAHTVRAGGGGFLGTFFHVMTRATGMSVEQGALSQIRAATDPGARGGTMYGPRYGTFGPPVRKPLVRPGTSAAIRALWEVSRRETGLDVDVAAALQG